jgi:hypothetical protein
VLLARQELLQDNDSLRLERCHTPAVA